ncbi:hypothetical protein EGW08_004912 [Elysia chlorotica]|uniref:BHLH domain-containing protein n=1 Tax=Elysia chlorotica TaxID=188477 RepID=A0A3S1BMU5_ELYCH|nr:hypothetical protein EGW08_004912 [Elysia chlorotica]
MKRSMSDSDSDDGFDERLKSGSPSQSCQITDRKKRRGIIEKRRRDRINTSLSELRRLVPSAFEKQGSAKLEKAEILQMTVDHLKILHQKGINSYNFDPHAVAVDYRGVGFRECAAEVARYLVAVEGLDLQDPLRVRLLGHLQCYSAQREAAAKASLQGGGATSWGVASGMMGTMTGTVGGVMGAGTHHTNSAPGGGSSGSFTGSQHPQASHHHHHSDSILSGHMRLSATSSAGSNIGSGGPPLYQSNTGLGSAPPSSQLSPPLFSTLPSLHPHPQFTSLNVNPVSSMMSHPSSAYQHMGLNQGNSSVKPYRPWGGELAY